MHLDFHDKLIAMLWDIHPSRRKDIADAIMSNPVELFHNDDQLFIKALNSLKWHELIRLLGKENLLLLLTDSTIRKLFPVQRRTYYSNARRLLSKYTLPAAGQST
jgi:ABC-type lipopolysaccharide export system ATPase subunit